MENVGWRLECCGNACARLIQNEKLISDVWCRRVRKGFFYVFEVINNLRQDKVEIVFRFIDEFIESLKSYGLIRIAFPIDFVKLFESFFLVFSEN